MTEATTTPNHYTTLAIPPSATATLIRHAYTTHLQTVPSLEALDLLEDAFTTLSTPILRLLYDAELAVPAPLQPMIATIRLALNTAPDQAATLLESLARKYPSPPPALLLAAGQLLLKLDRPAKATRLLRRLCDLCPGDPTHLIHLGLSVHAEGQLAQAAGILEKALAQDPSHALGCDTLARYYLFTLRDPDAAIALLDRSAPLQAEPDDRLLVLGTLFMALVLGHYLELVKATVEPLLQALQPASALSQVAVISELLSLAQAPAIKNLPAISMVLVDLMLRIQPRFQALAPVEPDPALEAEAKRLLADPAIPEWLSRLVDLLNTGYLSGPFRECCGNPREKALAYLRARYRLDAPAMRDRWAAGAAAFPLVAARLQPLWEEMTSPPANPAPAS